MRAPRRVATSRRVQGRLLLATLAGELAEAYPDRRIDFAHSFDQWEASIRDGLRATHQRGDLQRPADPDRLATGLFAAIHLGLLLTQVHRDTAPLEAALQTMLEHVASLTVRRCSAVTKLLQRSRTHAATFGFMARTWRPPLAAPYPSAAFASCPKPQMHRRGALLSCSAAPLPDRCLRAPSRRSARLVPGTLGTPASEWHGNPSRSRPYDPFNNHYDVEMTFGPTA